MIFVILSYICFLLNITLSKHVIIQFVPKKIDVRNT
jgi:hypothetical protein